MQEVETVLVLFLIIGFSLVFLYWNLCSRMASRKTARKGRRGTLRANSNIFTMFDQDQIREFKEAFNVIDFNHDGIIDKEDLAKTFPSFGKLLSDTELEEMIKEAPGPINFTMFLTMFGEKLAGTDPEDVIRNAFSCFDMNNSGTVNEEKLREMLTMFGDRISEEDVDDILRDAPIKNGQFDYVEFTRVLKHGVIDKDDANALENIQDDE